MLDNNSHSNNNTELDQIDPCKEGYISYTYHPSLNIPRPTLRLSDVLKITSVSRSKAYELMKTDPDFPKGIPLYDGANSPKFYWAHEVAAWVMKRDAKYRSKGGVKGNV